MISLNEVIVGTIDLIVMNNLIFFKLRKTTTKEYMLLRWGWTWFQRYDDYLLLFVVCIQKQVKLIDILGDCWLLYLLLQKYFPYMNVMHAVRPTACCYHLNVLVTYLWTIPLDLLLAVHPELFIHSTCRFFFLIPFSCFSCWLCLVVCIWRYWRFVNNRTCIMMYNV